MAKEVKVNKKGIELKEYPKLVKLENGKKVRVLSEADEEALNNPKKKAGWDK